MKIVVDARFWGPKHTGLGVYTQNLVTNLALTDKRNSYILLVRNNMADEISGLPDNFKTETVEAGAYTMAEQFKVALKLYQLSPDLVHFPSTNIPVFYFGKFVVTVHDLIKQESRGLATTTRNPFMYWLKFLAYLLVFRWLLFRSAHILAPSQTVKNQLLKSYKLPTEKVTVTYEAATISSTKFSSKLELPAKFGLYVGNAYPHKNLSNLMLSWKEVYRQTGRVLLIVSGRSVFSERIEKFISDNNAGVYVKNLGFVPEDQMSGVYENASIYVFPSLMEGFGLPGLTAMRYGTPVACSDIPVFREIYGPAAQYFDPKDISDMSRKIIEVVNDLSFRSKLVLLGKSRVRRYSWKKMARQTLKVYESSASL